PDVVLLKAIDIATSPDGETVFVLAGVRSPPGSFDVLILAYATRDPLGIVGRLSADIVELNLFNGLEAGLMGKLDAVSRLLQDTLSANDAGAASVLAGFIHAIEGQAGKEIQEVDARRLRALAADAISLIKAELQ
ncbi:MAG: hypothetical protein O7C74_09115, partial [Acidobacteria bacterium]|nr:hypothetical protein [Acidobacteriota bacterium]